MRAIPAGFYSAEQVRELDRCAIAAGTPGAELMRRAAAAAWRELLYRWPKARRVAVACGPGNNGGDGYELARLARAAGLDVDLWRIGEPATRGDAVGARKAWLAEGGKEQVYRGAGFAGDVVVDALFGTGLSRAPEGQAQAAILAINAARERGAGIVALDVPSGLDADRGCVPGDAIRADLTVTFIGAKPGLYTGAGPDHAGAIVLDDLDVAPDSGAPLAQALDARTLASLLPRRARSAHKGRMGHVLLVGGEHGTAGAILLAARAALRAGAGLVTVATRAAHVAALTAAQPELMCQALEEPRALRALFEDKTVVAIGPGLGRGEWGGAVWSQVLTAEQPLVVDADALNWLAENPERRDDWVLTPHPGEAARLLGVKNAEVQRDRIDASRRLVGKYGGTCVLKGAGTLVRGTGLGLCAHGNPGMASGGMGDALCGLVAGLMAQGLSGESAARAGVAAHALAADRAARAGERGLIADDVIAGLRPLLNP